LLPVFATKAAVGLDIVHQQRRFVDDGKFGDTRRKINSISLFYYTAQANAGLDKEGLSIGIFEEQYRAYIGIDDFKGPLQGYIEEIFRVEGNITEIG